MSKLLFKFNEKTKENFVLFFISIIIAIFSTSAGQGPINVGLDLKTSDMISYSIIGSNEQMFAGSIIGDIAKSVNNFIPLNRILLEYASFGRAPEYVHVLLYFINVLVRCFALLAIGKMLSGKIAGGIVALALVGFCLDYQIISGRIISSTIGTTFGFCVVYFLFLRNYFMSSLLSGITVFAHPSFGVFLICLTPLVYVLNLVFDENIRKFSSKELFGATLPGTSCLLPILFFGWNEVFASSIPINIDKQTFWDFVPQLNNLAFPLERGLAYVTSFILIYVLAFILSLKTKSKNEHSSIFASLIFGLLTCFCMQILFTSVIQDVFLTKFALNHRANQIAFPVFLLLFLTGLDKKKSLVNAKSSFYAALIFALLFFDGWSFVKSEQPTPLLKMLGSTNFTQAHMLLSLLIALFVEFSTSLTKKIILSVVAIFLILGFCYLYQKLAFLYFLLPIAVWNFSYKNLNTLFANGGMSLVCWGSKVRLIRVLENVKIHKFSWASVFEKFKVKRMLNQNMMGQIFFRLPILAMFCAIGLFLQMPKEDTISSWSRLISGEMRYHWAKHFLEPHVSKNEHILIVPLRGPGNWLSPTPWRRAYLDSSEGHFLIYQQQKLPNYLAKLSLYAGGEELNLKRPDLKRVWGDAVGIRRGIKAIGQFDPKVRWVITFDKFMCGEDKVFAEYDGYSSGPPGYLGKVVLINLSDFDTECVPAL